MQLRTNVLCSAIILLSTAAHAALPMGLKCEPNNKIVEAEVGKVGEYEVQKGMEKEKHTALTQRKKVTPIDACSFNVEVGQTIVARYSGPQNDTTEVQCVDLNNSNAQVKFPPNIFTVRNSNISPHYLNPYCPDGSSKDGFPCSKLGTQSERGMEYKEKVLRSNGGNRLFVADLVFDPANISRQRPFAPSVPSNAKLFCALITKSGNVLLAATAQYPEIAATQDTASGTADKAERDAPKSAVRERLERAKREAVKN